MNFIKPSIYRLIILFLLLGSTQSFGQNSEVSGVLVDSQTKKPLSFVQVAIFENKESSTPEVFGDTDENGEFSLKVSPGTYFFKAFFLGYSDFTVSDVEVSGSVDLGTLEMKSENQNLEEIVVETSKMPIRSTMEGITITPENNLANTGGTLLDVLRNTPSISVSEDGAVSLRGSSGTNILINGRNSSLTQNLDQLPASAVEEIRVINNPNARYDAEAEAGVIDIVLKKGLELGTHGGVEATYGTRNRTNLGGRISHRGLKLNTYAGYNYRNWKQIGNRESTRFLFEENESLVQNTNNTDHDIGHNLNFGADYYFGNNTLSYEGVFQSSENWQVNTLYAEQLKNEDVFDYVRRNSENETDDGWDNALIFEHSFKDKGHLLRALASHSYRNQYKTQDIEIFNNSQSPDPENLTGRERAFTDEVRDISVFQFDYIRPWEDQKIEMGLKSTIRKFDNDFQYLRFDEVSQDFVVNPDVSNHFIYKDQIHAGYFVYSNTKPKFEYALGLRGEYTKVDTYLANTNEENKQSYFNLFPSVQGLYNLNENHSLKITYSRRIDRPRAWRLNPFPDITDSLNVRRGNPELQPEMINSYEFGHLANFEKSSFTTNLFYRKVNGQIDFITFIEDGISYSQPDNLLSSQSYGVEFIATSELSDWYSLNGGLTLFQIAVDGSNISEEFTNSGFSWNVKLTQEFKLPLGINFQLVGNYESPEIEAQGRDLAQYYFDGSLQKSFFDGKGSLTFSARDIFDTRRFAGTSMTNTFSQEFYSKRETQIYLLSARFNF